MGFLTVIASGKGGTGKSTLSVGLACAFQKRGRKVLLIDVDEGLRCLDLMLGVSDRLVFDIGDIINYSKPLDDVVLNVTENIDLIAAPATLNGYDKKRFGEFLHSVTDRYDHVIVDCPAGLDVEFFNALPIFSEVLIVEPLDMIGCRSAATLETLLHAAGIKHVFLVINRFDYFVLKGNSTLSLDDIVDKSGLMIRGVVPYDPNLPLLSAEGKLFDRNCVAFRAFCRIADRLEAKDVPLPKLNNL